MFSASNMLSALSTLALCPLVLPEVPVFRPSKLHLGCEWTVGALVFFVLSASHRRHGLGVCFPGGTFSSLPSPGAPPTDRSALPLVFSFIRSL